MPPHPEPPLIPRDIPRITPGKRVCYRTNRIIVKVGYGYVLEPEEDWGDPENGTVVPPELHPGWHYSPDHAWGVKEWETVVMFDKPRDDTGRRVERIPTAMLETLHPE